MFNTNVLHTKIIHNEAELQRTPLVAPEARGGSCFIEPLGNKTSPQKIIGKDASLGKTITSLTNFEVFPTIAVPTSEVVFLDEFIRDVGELDAHIFGIWHRSVKVEVLEINGAKPSAFPGEDTVEEEFDKFQGCGVGTNIARVANAVAADSDTGAIGVIFLWANFTDHHSMTDLFAFVKGDVWVVNEKESVGTSYSLFRRRVSRPDALAETT
jgi:hypothetical protein